GEYLAWPQLLPDGDTVLFAVGGSEAFGIVTTMASEATIVTQSLRSGTRTTIVRGASAPRYVASGHLLFVQGATLYAAPFDFSRPAEVVGAVQVVEGIRRFPGTGMTPQYDVSSNGTLAYIAGPTRFASSEVTLVLSDKAGKISPLPLQPR